MLREKKIVLHIALSRCDSTILLRTDHGGCCTKAKDLAQSDSNYKC